MSVKSFYSFFPTLVAVIFFSLFYFNTQKRYEDSNNYPLGFKVLNDSNYLMDVSSLNKVFATHKKKDTFFLTTLSHISTSRTTEKCYQISEFLLNISRIKINTWSYAYKESENNNVMTNQLDIDFLIL